MDYAENGPALASETVRKFSRPGTCRTKSCSVCINRCCYVIERRLAICTGSHDEEEGKKATRKHGIGCFSFDVQHLYITHTDTEKKEILKLSVEGVRAVW